MRSNKSDLIQIITNGGIFNLTKDSNTRSVCIVNILLFSIITIGINYLYFSEIIYFQTFGDQLVGERINLMFELTKKWQWLGYALIPIVVLIRVGFTAICLYIGLFVVDLKTPFRDLFNGFCENEAFRKKNEMNTIKEVESLVMAQQVLLVKKFRVTSLQKIR